MSCLGMPMTGSQTFPLPSIIDFLTSKQCSADSDHQKGSQNLVLDATHPLKYAAIVIYCDLKIGWLSVVFMNHFINGIEFHGQRISMSGKRRN